MNWRPIENEPKPSGFVLISNSHHWLKVYWNCAINEWCDEDGEQLFGMKPTHFMLVTPPGEQQQHRGSCVEQLIDAAEYARDVCFNSVHEQFRSVDAFRLAYRQLDTALELAKSEQPPESVNQRLLTIAMVLNGQCKLMRHGFDRVDSERAKQSLEEATKAADAVINETQSRPVESVNQRLLDAIQHLRMCSECSEGSLEDCEGGQEVLAAIEAAKQAKQ